MKYLGIWTKDLSKGNILSLVDQGFNSLFLQVGFFYDNTLPNYVNRQDATVALMYDAYSFAKKLGYKYFLIDCGWGLGELDGNYFYEKIIAKFKDCEDVDFYLGEPIESFVETGKYSFEQVCEKIIQPRFKLMPRENLIMDATTRNYIKLYNYAPGKVGISSYYNQHQYWSHSSSHVWIYGQLKIGGSLCYKKLSSVANSMNIEKRFLYQDDPDTWSWKDLSSWLNTVLKWLHLGNWFESLQRKRFIKYFGK